MRDFKKFDFDFNWSALDQEEQESMRACDFPGCNGNGEYPAPRSPKRLQDRFYFCINHIREYNANWNFYAAMTPEETRFFDEQDRVGWRPSWAFGNAMNRNTRIRDHLGIFHQFADFESTGINEEASGHQNYQSNWFAPETPEEKAVVLLELSVPFTDLELKTAYKNKAKACHPDLNPDDPDAIHRFRTVKEAYDLLLRLLKSIT